MANGTILIWAWDKLYCCFHRASSLHLLLTLCFTIACSNSTKWFFLQEKTAAEQLRAEKMQLLVSLAHLESSKQLESSKVASTPNLSAYNSVDSTIDSIRTANTHGWVYFAGACNASKFDGGLEVLDHLQSMTSSGFAKHSSAPSLWKPRQGKLDTTHYQTSESEKWS